MARVQVKQIRSTIGRDHSTVKTMEALGLRKINSVVEHEVNDSFKGQLNKIKHLVQVTEI